MTITTIKMPPGVFRNGTRYQAKGRWFSANRVRWYNGAIKPIGGWEQREDVNGALIPALTSADEYIRDGHAWRDNDKQQYAVFGSNETLYWLRPDGVAEDINSGPVVAPGNAQPALASGYGTGLYGLGAYGVTPPELDATLNDVARWKFDNWGENLLALPDWDGGLYEWVPSTGNDIAAVTNAPTDITDFIVTQERIVMTVGGAELRVVRWSDQENNTQWTPAIDNQAGSYVLPGVGKIIGIYKLRNQALILTETDAWTARYIGPPYVYSFEKVGDQCAPVHKSAAALLPNGALMWFGEQNFWVYDGSVNELPCDVIDFLISDLDKQNLSKMFFWINADFREVWMHYPSVRDEPVTDPSVVPAGVECGQYVSFNWTTMAWSQGELQRTCAIPKGVYPYPQMTKWDGKVFWHERVGVNYDDGSPASVKSGPLELGEGDRNMALRYMYTDSQQGEWSDGTVPKGTLLFFFEYRQTPNGTELTSPSYEYSPDRNQPTAIRVLGRDIMLNLVGSTGSSINWEWGNFRLDIAEGGAR